MNRPVRWLARCTFGGILAACGAIWAITVRDNADSAARRAEWIESVGAGWDAS